MSSPAQDATGLLRVPAAAVGLVVSSCWGQDVSENVPASSDPTKRIHCMQLRDSAGRLVPRLRADAPACPCSGSARLPVSEACALDTVPFAG